MQLTFVAKDPGSEPSGSRWLRWWLDMLREHRAAGRCCRRARVVSEPLSDYPRWTLSHAELAVFLHYAGSGTNASFEITEDPATVRSCREAFVAVWATATPFRAYRPE